VNRVDDRVLARRGQECLGIAGGSGVAPWASPSLAGPGDPPESSAWSRSRRTRRRGGARRSSASRGSTTRSPAGSTRNRGDTPRPACDEPALQIPVLRSSMRQRPSTLSTRIRAARRRHDLDARMIPTLLEHGDVRRRRDPVGAPDRQQILCRVTGRRADEIRRALWPRPRAATASPATAARTPPRDLRSSRRAASRAPPPRDRPASRGSCARDRRGERPSPRAPLATAATVERRRCQPSPIVRTPCLRHRPEAGATVGGAWEASRSPASPSALAAMALAAAVAGRSCRVTPSRVPRRRCARCCTPAKTGDREAVFSLLSPATRSRLEVEAKRATDLVGAATRYSAQDLLSIGSSDGIAAPTDITVLEERGGSCERRGRVSDGRARIELLKVEGRWRIELPQYGESGNAGRRRQVADGVAAVSRRTRG